MWHLCIIGGLLGMLRVQIMLDTQVWYKYKYYLCCLTVSGSGMLVYALASSVSDCIDRTYITKIYTA